MRAQLLYDWGAGAALPGCSCQFVSVQLLCCVVWLLCVPLHASHAFHTPCILVSPHAGPAGRCQRADAPQLQELQPQRAAVPHCRRASLPPAVCAAAQHRWARCAAGQHLQQPACFYGSEGLNRVPSCVLCCNVLDCACLRCAEEQLWLTFKVPTACAKLCAMLLCFAVLCRPALCRGAALVEQAVPGSCSAAGSQRGPRQCSTAVEQPCGSCLQLAVGGWHNLCCIRRRDGKCRTHHHK